MTKSFDLAKIAGNTGNVKVPQGTLSAPSIHIQGDLDTGLYSPGANQLDLVTGGVKALDIDASGIVTTPTRPSCLVTGGAAGAEPAGIVKFPTIRHNIGSNYSVSTGRFTAPVDGIYGISTGALSNSVTTVQRYVWLNGSALIQLENSDITTSGYRNISGYIEVNMTTGDYIEMYNNQIQYGSLYSWLSAGLLG